MNMLKKLPGFDRAPAGLEWAFLRRVPMLSVAGTVVPLLCLGMVRLAAVSASDIVSSKLEMSIQIALASLVIFYWTALFTAGLGSVITMIAKGPAYVADAYPLPDADAPVP